MLFLEHGPYTQSRTEQIWVLHLSSTESKLAHDPYVLNSHNISVLEDSEVMQPCLISSENCPETTLEQ